MLGFRKNRDVRCAAIRALQHLIEREPPTPDDEYLLCQLYQADGNWSKAEGQLKSLLAGHGENPVFLAHYTMILLHRRSTDEAQAVLDKLEKQEPKSLRTLELKARLLAARGRASEAVPLLKSVAEGNARHVAYIAALLEDLGETAPAEELMRRFAQSGQPRACLVLAGFLGRHNRISEALDLCEKAGDSIPHEVIAEAIVTVLYSGRIDESECDRAGRWLEDSLAKAPGNAGLLFHLGNVRSLQGRYREAEAFYRESHARDANNSGPLANLAWLLAPGSQRRRGPRYRRSGHCSRWADTRPAGHTRDRLPGDGSKRPGDQGTRRCVYLEPVSDQIRSPRPGLSDRRPACRSRRGPGKGEGSGAENGKPLTPRNGCLSRIA